MQDFSFWPKTDSFEMVWIEGPSTYEELTRAFIAKFMTCSQVPEPIDFLLTIWSMSTTEGETLKAYSLMYWELYHNIGRNHEGVVASMFKVRFSINSKLQNSVTQNQLRICRS